MKKFFPWDSKKILIITACLVISSVKNIAQTPAQINQEHRQKASAKPPTEQITAAVKRDTSLIRKMTDLRIPNAILKAEVTIEIADSLKNDLGLAIYLLDQNGKFDADVSLKMGACLPGENKNFPLIIQYPYDDPYFADQMTGRAAPMQADISDFNCNKVNSSDKSNLINQLQLEIEGIKKPFKLSRVTLTLSFANDKYSSHSITWTNVPLVTGGAGFINLEFDNQFHPIQNPKKIAK
ncbi:MAG: hypothetical protein JST87_02390 [Bacteroidetes bacterium]|nr:hypothetical protein [Bacteroidota bacterium]